MEGNRERRRQEIYDKVDVKGICVETKEKLGRITKWRNEINKRNKIELENK